MPLRLGTVQLNAHGLPWFKFFTSDWRGDAALRMCSLAARGLWVECLCLMHDGDPYGHLAVNGKAIDSRQLALLVGAPADEVEILLEELESNGVLRRNRQGVAICAHLIKSKKASEQGRKAANRRWGKPTEISGSSGDLNGSTSRPSTAENPEARVQSSPEPHGPETTDVVELKARIFGTCLEWLQAHTGLEPAKLRRWLGKLCRDYGDGQTLEALQAANRAQPVDAVAWVEHFLRSKGERYAQPRRGEQTSPHRSLLAGMARAADRRRSGVE